MSMESDWDWWTQALGKPLRLGMASVHNCETCERRRRAAQWYEPNGHVMTCEDCGESHDFAKEEYERMEQHFKEEVFTMHTPWGDVTSLVTRIMGEDPPIGEWTVIAMNAKWTVYEMLREGEHGRSAGLRMQSQSFSNQGVNRGRVRDHSFATYKDLELPRTEEEIQTPTDQATVLAWLLWPAVREVNLLLRQMHARPERSVRLSTKGSFSDCEWLDCEWEANGALGVRGVDYESFMGVMEEP